jgi:hypothetical protein
MTPKAGVPPMPPANVGLLGCVRSAALVVVFSSFLSLAALAAHAQSSPAPVGELFPVDVDVRNPALQVGTGLTVTNGTQLAAGEAPAVLRLARGGQVRLCPGSGLGVNTVPGNDGLLLSMSAGSIVVNYALQDFADTLVTPDFRVLMAGPGTFHFALGVTSRGDTCAKPMAGNSSRLILSEVFGTGTYQIKEDEAVLFSGGKLSGRTSITAECGCPGAAPIQRASIAVEPGSVESGDASAPPTVSSPAAPALAPPDKPGHIKVAVETPFVFSAKGSSPPYSVARVNFSTLPNVFSLQERVKPSVPPETAPEVSAKAEEPPAPKKEKKEKKGFMGKVKGFFSGIFHS